MKKITTTKISTTYAYHPLFHQYAEITFTITHRGRYLNFPPSDYHWHPKNKTLKKIYIIIFFRSLFVVYFVIHKTPTKDTGHAHTTHIAFTSIEYHHCIVVKK